MITITNLKKNLALTVRSHYSGTQSVSLNQMLGFVFWSTLHAAVQGTGFGNITPASWLINSVHRIDTNLKAKISLETVKYTTTVNRGLGLNSFSTINKFKDSEFEIRIQRYHFFRMQRYHFWRNFSKLIHNTTKSQHLLVWNLIHNFLIWNYIMLQKNHKLLWIKMFPLHNG